MTDEKPEEFGKSAPPPVVMHKPRPLGEQPATGQKRSLAISLVAMGALSLGAYEAIDWLDKKLNCEPDPANPDELICKHHSSSSSYRRSRGGWHWGGGSGSTHGLSFGGFGHSGGFHFGGG